MKNIPSIDCCLHQHTCMHMQGHVYTDTHIILNVIQNLRLRMIDGDNLHQPMPL